MPTDSKTQKVATCTNASATTVLARNAARKRLSMQAFGTNTGVVYVSFNGDASATNCAYALSAGAGFVYEVNPTANEISIIGSVAGAQSVAMEEG